MPSIKITEITPVETQIEDLSEDMTGRIQGGGALDDIRRAVKDLRRLIRDAGDLIEDFFNEPI